MNLRRNCPNVAGTYTWSNNRFIPPEKTTCESSMLSAPAAIPAMIELSSTAGVHPRRGHPRLTGPDPLSHPTREPSLFGQRRHRDQPADDAKRSSSNSGVPLHHR
jgi:hypothetical protein